MGGCGWFTTRQGRFVRRERGLLLAKLRAKLRTKGLLLRGAGVRTGRFTGIGRRLTKRTRGISKNWRRMQG